MDVISRLALWLLFNVIAALVLIAVYEQVTEIGLRNNQLTRPDIQAELVTITLLYVCSVLALLWPGAHRELRVLGVVWAFAGGLFVFLLWAIAGGWILYWLLHA